MAASALIAAPMIAVFFLGWRAFGLPFVPFDLFDALSRLLPGPVITHAIERMVAVIQALHLGATATIAKSAEQAMAVALFFVLFVVIAAVFLVIPKRTEGRSGIPSGLVLGILVAFLRAPPIAGGRTARVNPGIGIPWSLFILMIWGFVMGWLRGRDGASAPPRRPRRRDQPAPDTHPARGGVCRDDYRGRSGRGAPERRTCLARDRGGEEVPLVGDSPAPEC